MGILVGDIGGTKTALAMAEHTPSGWRLEAEWEAPSGAYPSLESLLRAYLENTGRHGFRAAAFAVAGPVAEGRSQVTNLPWTLEAEALASAFGGHPVVLLNDLEAIAWGLPALEEKDLAVLHPGDPRALGNACVLAAGTGLGEAGLYWDGECHRPFASEGGHADFAPANSQEVALWQWLAARYGHVSWERLVSGQGIGHLQAFLAAERGLSLDQGRHATADGDRAAAVAACAAVGDCRLCVDTMLLFASLYGREAGNLALKHLALSGVYLGGGIAPKNLEWLRAPAFLAGFFAKGRMEPLLRRMPVRVILRPQTPLLGAARFLWAGREGTKIS